jgi:hypothetical protein
MEGEGSDDESTEHGTPTCTKFLADGLALEDDM